jgi:hypothetical protein
MQATTDCFHREWTSVTDQGEQQPEIGTIDFVSVLLLLVLVVPSRFPFVPLVECFHHRSHSFTPRGILSHDVLRAVKQ